MSEQAVKKSTWAALAVFFEHRTLVMLGLGFAAGLPFLLVFDTLSAWLREAGLELTVIAYFVLATLAHSLKFLWAPLVDRFDLPVLTRLVGHRRSWMLACQGVIIFGLWVISGLDPIANLGLIAVFAVLVAFGSATQDIVIDAWRIEAAGEERQGAMAAAYQWGYRLAILTAGVVPLLIADAVNWNLAYAAMACLMGVGVAAVLFAPRENPRPIMPPLMPQDMPYKPREEAVEWAARLALLVVGALAFGSGFTGQIGLIKGAFGLFGGAGLTTGLEALWALRPMGVFVQFVFVLLGAGMIVLAAWTFPGRRTRPGVYFARSYGDPFKDFFTRFAGSAGLILAMICCYRLSDFVMNVMNPFYLDLGFDKTRIAEIRKGFGVVMMMVGVFFAGWSIARFGLIKSLVVGAFCGPLSNLVFAWLAIAGPDWRVFATAIAVDNITGSFAGTVLIAYMSSLTSAGFTATQYALFSSLYALPGKLIAAQSGTIIEGSARWTEAGGLPAGLMGLFANLPAQSFAEGAAKISVSPAALGTGYLIFFFYSCLIGVAGVILAFIIAHKRAQAAASAQGVGPDPQASPAS
ncbi:MAG: AmpG family muropeptide MFS transporter [Caulobacterales bacterium]|jgi:PAT family beta-lactamase induction signal transducer AmpG